MWIFIGTPVSDATDSLFGSRMQDSGRGCLGRPRQYCGGIPAIGVAPSGDFVTFNEVKVLYAYVAVIVQVCEAWKAHLVCVRKAHRDLNSARRSQRVVLDVHIFSCSATSHPIFHDSLTTIRPQAAFSGRSFAITKTGTLASLF
jgi:hypothetical protein